MISELVAGSACTWPPVDGRADVATGVVDWAEGPVLPLVPVCVLGVGVVLARLSVLDVPPEPAAEPAAPLPPAPPAEMAARSSSAILVASEFFR